MNASLPALISPRTIADEAARVCEPTPELVDATTAGGEAAGPPDSAFVAEVLSGKTEVFKNLVTRYQPRIFAIARRYARRQDEVEDIVQEVFLRAYQKLHTYRGEAPFEHWLTRLGVRVCFDFLRQHQRSREISFTEMDSRESGWLESCVAAPEHSSDDADAARQLAARLLACVSPAARLVITLLEIEERSVKEIAQLTGWSVPAVKIRAFRARGELKRCLARLVRQKKLAREKYF